MSVLAVARPGSLRDIGWPVWVLIALAAVVMVYGFVQSGLDIGRLSFAAPILFAAAVAYAKPSDRRFLWGAVLIAVAPVVGVVTAVLPDLWFDAVPGDWKNATPLLMDLGHLARVIAQVLGFVGLGLLGLALGGIRTVLSMAIIVGGILVAAVVDVRSLPIGTEEWPIDLVVRSAAFPLLYAGGWAFVCAAALESRRRLMLIGTGLIFALILVDYLQALWLTTPDAALTLFLLVTSSLHLVGWVLVIVAALRGELNAARSRTSVEL